MDQRHNFDMQTKVKLGKGSDLLQCQLPHRDPSSRVTFHRLGHSRFHDIQWTNSASATLDQAKGFDRERKFKRHESEIGISGGSA
jgi:RIO-like serine/threonine protein kinase